MYLNRGNFNLRRTRRNNITRIVVYIVLIFAGLYVLNLKDRGDVQPLFVATPTATRSPASYAEEAQKQFSAGRLKDAINAYQKAIELDPQNADYWIKLARIQVYAKQPQEGVTSAETAILREPENSTAHAVHALALDWSGQVADASDAAVRAIQLDPNNALAYAYYAEILVDQQRWAQAGDAAKQALALDPNSMDAYRVYGYYLESTSNYEEAIQAYQSALKINPNLAFLYMQIGVNFRQLTAKAITPEEQQQNFDLAIQYFQRASAIDPNDIEPYRSISRTYFQMGEYGASAQYLEEALKIDPTNAMIHGDLGKVYFKALNYESAIIELTCAVDGCSTKDDTIDDDEGAPEFNITPLELNGSTLETFYIYGSVLSALSTPADPHCQRARPLIQQIRSWVQQNDPEDPVVFGILDENEIVCTIAEATAAALGGNLGTPALTSGTGTPGPTPTGTPKP
jgi:tetratricopeptide (TPR) repeat protein